MSTYLRMLPVWVACLISSCSTNAQDSVYCESLLEKARDPNIYEKLESWVYENISDRKLRRKDIKFHTRFVPGMYSFDGNFDWGLLGFDQQWAKVNLVGPSPGDFTDSDVAHIKSVLFAERSRYGILVKLPGSDNFGVGSDEEYILTISDNIAVICIEADR